jgi:quinol monooxygenase YgiN
MLVLTAFSEIAPAERDAIRATRADDGRDDYGCYEDVQQPGRVAFVERGRDQAALDRHVPTPHMIAWWELAGPRLATSHGSLHDVASTTELHPK